MRIIAGGIEGLSSAIHLLSSGTFSIRWSASPDKVPIVDRDWCLSDNSSTSGNVWHDVGTRTAPDATCSSRIELCSSQARFVEQIMTPSSLPLHSVVVMDACASLIDEVQGSPSIIPVSSRTISWLRSDSVLGWVFCGVSLQRLRRKFSHSYSLVIDENVLLEEEDKWSETWTLRH